MTNGPRPDGSPLAPLDPARYPDARDAALRALEALRNAIETDASLTSIRLTFRFGRGGTRTRRPFENLTVETLGEQRPARPA